MTNSPTPEPSPDAIIRDLHLIREAIVESFNGDLHALSEDARRRQEESGRPIWRKKPKKSPQDDSPADAK